MTLLATTNARGIGTCVPYEPQLTYQLRWQRVEVFWVESGHVSPRPRDPISRPSGVFHAVWMLAMEVPSCVALLMHGKCA